MQRDLDRVEGIDRLHESIAARVGSLFFGEGPKQPVEDDQETAVVGAGFVA